jgi:hypothetical protein
MKHKHHIIPRHTGGSDDPSNLVELTIQEHAEAHKILWEEHGRWQDYLAWQGLAGLMSKEEHAFRLLSEAGKKGSAQNYRRKGMTYNRNSPGKYGDRKGANNPGAMTYSITHPSGEVEKVKSLRTWCELHGFNYNSLHAQSKRGRPHNGYYVKKIISNDIVD